MKGIVMKRCLLFMVVTGIVCFYLMGCATQSSMNYSTNPSHKPGRLADVKKPASVFARIESADERQTQDFRKGDSVAYRRVHDNSTMKSISPDERDIAALEGRPDYIRHFRTIRGNNVDEWLYEDKDYQIQFKDGELVYCAPIDEQAKKVLEYGQPTKVKTIKLAGGQQQELFWYQHLWKWLVFTNGRLVIAQ